MVQGRQSTVFGDNGDVAFWSLGRSTDYSLSAYLIYHKYYNQVR